MEMVPVSCEGDGSVCFQGGGSYLFPGRWFCLFPGRWFLFVAREVVLFVSREVLHFKVALFVFACCSFLANNLHFMVKMIDKAVVINVKIHKNKRKQIYLSNKEGLIY
jgi:hypothetical protein